MFEEDLIESSKRQGDSRGPARPSPVSIAIHGLVIGVALGASDLVRRGRAGAADPGDFYAAAPRRRLCPRRPPRRPRPKPGSPEAVPVKSHRDGRPDDHPGEHPQALAGAPEPERRPASRGRVEGGVEGGVPGGVLGGVPACTGPGTGEGEPLRVGGEVKAPVLTNRVEPSYPEAARKARMEGVVILEAIITASGSVEEVTGPEIASTLPRRLGRPGGATVEIQARHLERAGPYAFT